MMEEHGGPKMGMGKRGVARPMAEMDSGGSGDDQDHEHGGGDDSGGEGHDHEMSHDDRLEMLHTHHRQTLWVYWTIVLLGFWMMLAPWTFGYDSGVVEPSGGRGVWFSDDLHTDLRVALTAWNDVICGVLLVIFGWRSLRPNRPVSLWICFFIGMWLTAAPVFFWAPTADAYLNDTIVGALLIALTILIPGMPNMIMYMQMGPATPPGWSYNPSSWPQRWIMIVTGFMGWMVSRYLAMFQLGYIDEIWEPFFGDGTRTVLNSKMSHMWPISDAGLGSLSYTFEFLMGYMGAPSRWRTMPWMVTFFGVLVIPLGLTHIFLVISQPLIVGAWCTMCLLAALIMLPMIPLEVDEVVAMGQHVLQAKRRGDRGGSLWTIFWKGGKADGCTPDERSPELIDLPARPWTVFKSSIWGMSFPWTLVVSTLMGIWVTLAPVVLGSTDGAKNLDHLVGMLVITVSVVAMGEVIRAARWLNALLGLGLIVATFVVDGGSGAAAMNDIVVGVILIALAVPRGQKRERYGLWDRFVR